MSDDCEMIMVGLDWGTHCYNSYDLKKLCLTTQKYMHIRKIERPLMIVTCSTQMDGMVLFVLLFPTKNVQIIKQNELFPRKQIINNTSDSKWDYQIHNYIKIK